MSYKKQEIKQADLQDSVLEVNIYQSILKPYETGVFTVSNDMDIANMMPIIIGSTIEFKIYTFWYKFYKKLYCHGVRIYNRAKQKSKQLEITSISSEYYAASLDKKSKSYTGLKPNEIFERVVKEQGSSVKWFQVDECESNDWIIPHGANKGKFCSGILPVVSPLPDFKSYLIATKEGYSICGFQSFTEKFKETYEIQSGTLGLTLAYGGHFPRKMDSTGTIESFNRARKFFPNSRL